ncbi:MAG: flagellar filament capping protein FliD [Sphingomonadales bacterium]|nr:flagellar filament capping protein FliD [Sphingomonadales bacterium]
MTTTSATATSAAGIASSATATSTPGDSASLGSQLATALGGGTGIDMTNLASEVASAQFAGQLSNLATSLSTVNTQISEASQLKSDLLSLTNALTSAIQSGSLASNPTVANGAVATASLPAGESGASGGYTLEVDSLASAQVLTSPGYASASATTGSGTLTITTGTIASGAFTAGSGTPVTVTIPTGATLSDVATAINSAGAGVTAYVANVSGGAQLVVKGAQGAANAFTISATGNASDPGLSQLAWNPSTGNPAQISESAANASYKLDGIAQTSASNAIANAAPGLALTLTGTNAGNPTSITYGNPSNAIVSAMQNFTTGLNAIASELKTDTQGNPGASGNGTTTTGALRGDLAAQDLQSGFQQLCGQTIMPGAAPGAPATLADLGLSQNQDGSFTLNTQTLSNALAANPGAVAAMFTLGPSGINNTVFNLVNAVTSTNQPGSLDYSISTYTANQTSLQTRQGDLLTRQSALRTQLISEYASANAEVATDKSTLTYLQDQIASWNYGGLNAVNG